MKGHRLDIVRRGGTAATALAAALIINLFHAAPAHATPSAITGILIADGLIATLIYSSVGIFMAFMSYKIIDLLTPGDLSRELTENKNVALALLTGSMILGICIIIAAAIAG